MSKDDIDMMKLYIFSSCYSALISSDRHKDEWTIPMLADDALEYARAGWKVFAEKGIVKSESED